MEGLQKLDTCKNSVQTGDGVINRRNRIYLHCANNSFKQEDEGQAHINRTTTDKVKKVGSCTDLLVKDLLENEDSYGCVVKMPDGG